MSSIEGMGMGGVGVYQARPVGRSKGTQMLSRGTRPLSEANPFAKPDRLDLSSAQAKKAEDDKAQTASSYLASLYQKATGALKNLVAA